MTKIGLVRCPDNAGRCPLTSCFKALREKAQGFVAYDDTELVGVFTLTGDPETDAGLAKILKAKGAEAVHLATCAFARKADGAWVAGGGFVPDPDALLAHMAKEAGLPCVKGSAHLPQGYEPMVFA